MYRDEAETSRRSRVAAAGDEDMTETRESGRATGPIGEREQWMHRAAGSVGGHGTSIVHRRFLQAREQLWIGARAGGAEESAVRLLRRVRETALEAAEQDRSSPVSHWKRIAP